MSFDDSEVFDVEMPKKVIKREKFTPSEDQQILKLVEKYGQDWDKIVEEFGSQRSKRQLRERWQNYLNPECDPSYTKEEDELLMRLVEELGQKWSKIASVLGNKSGISCRNRHRVLIKTQKRFFPPRPSSARPMIKKKLFPIPIARPLSPPSSQSESPLSSQEEPLFFESLNNSIENYSASSNHSAEGCNNSAEGCNNSAEGCNNSAEGCNNSAEGCNNSDSNADGKENEHDFYNSSDFEYDSPKIEANWETCGMFVNEYDDEDEFFIDPEYLC